MVVQLLSFFFLKFLSLSCNWIRKDGVKGTSHLVWKWEAKAPPPPPPSPAPTSPIQSGSWRKTFFHLNFRSSVEIIKKRIIPKIISFIQNMSMTSSYLPPSVSHLFSGGKQPYSVHINSVAIIFTHVSKCGNNFMNSTR